MMGHRLVFATAATWLALSTCLPVEAAVEISAVQTLDLETRPLDAAFSPGGDRVFVLLEGGRVEIYSIQGQLVDAFTVEGGYDRLLLSPRGDILLLGSQSRKSLELRRLEFIQSFATARSPVKGPGDAAVEIVVFNDFQ